MAGCAMCKGDGCTVKDFCYRHAGPRNGDWQPWLSEVPGEDEYCAWYKPHGENAPNPDVSKKTFQALTIVRDVPGGICPADFAEKMWPESEGWDRVAKCGPNGSHRGGGMYRAAGGLLGKLRKRGLVTRTRDCLKYRITVKGRRALRYAVENRQGEE